MSRSVVVRFQQRDHGGSELDEVIGGYVHVESMGDHVWALVAEDQDCASIVHISFHVERKPLREWWDAIKDAWYERTWPRFYRVGMSITSDERLPQPLPEGATHFVGFGASTESER